jgi:magnesium chelatase subunit D
VNPPASPPSPWQEAQTAAALFAVAPHWLGGIVLRACPGPVRETWLASLRDLFPSDTPWRPIPQHVTEARLLGGLDLAATLRAGRPLSERGLLSECDGGVAVLAMAERASRSTVAQIAAALDHGEVLLEREGVAGRYPAVFGLVALDESLDDEDPVSVVLQDRLAFHLDLRSVGIRGIDDPGADAGIILEARARLPVVQIPEPELQALTAVSMAFGVDSLRAVLLASRVARASAALAGRDAVARPDIDLAARLVLVPRATRLLSLEEPPAESPEPPEPETPPESPEENSDADPGDPGDRPLEDQVLEAVAASIPAGLLAALKAGRDRRAAKRAAGKSGAVQRALRRGRPMGAVAGDPRRGARLNLIATLRAAAPWQPVRRREQAARTGTSPRVLVRRDDFRITRYRQRSETTTIFVVDASGSAALHRLAEAKGAVELLLADCYVRRDQVALIAFRGREAELLLPPTRSLVRAKRNIAALPGGGGTPLASAIDAAALLAEQIQRRGGTPGLVFLTDGRANIARDGTQGRERANAEALAAAPRLRLLQAPALLIDTSPRPNPAAAQLAAAMGAAYLPMPHAEARRLRDAVQAGTGAGRRQR